MTKLVSLLARHWLGIVSFVLIVGALATLVAERRPTGSSITCRATNPGLQLGRDDGRVFVHPEGRTDELVAEGHLLETIEVPPGEYDVRILLSRSHDRQSAWLRGIGVTKDGTERCEVGFTSGELQVDATGSATTETARIIAYAYAEDDHAELLASMPATEPAFISAGSYDVRVVLTEDSEEKDVRWLNGVVVETGLRTRMSVAFRRGTLLVNADNAGTELPTGAVTFDVHRAGDEQLEVVDSGAAGIPLSLPVGSYDVQLTFSASHDKPTRWLHGVAIENDETHAQTVEFSSGAASVDVEIQNGEPVDDFAAYVYYYPQGDHEKPIAYTPPGGHAVLETGWYDARVSYLRSHDQPDLWLRDIEITPGEVVTRTASFGSGRLLVRAYDGDGTELVGDNVFIFVYSPGEHTRPLAKARSGELLILVAGAYDLRVTDTREPSREIWLSTVPVRSASLTEKRVELTQ